MRRTKLKNKIVFALCICLMFMLCSCGGSMTDESVRTELERLLPISYELNEIFWGKGLAFTEDDTNNRYLPVSQDCEYNSIEDILNKAEDIFSSEYMEIIKDAVFTDSDDIDPRYMDLNGQLLADSSYEGFDIQGNIVIESAVIKRQNSKTVVVSAEYEDGGTTEVILVLEDGKWLLNSPTY